MSDRMYYARTRENDPDPSRWQELEIHLRETAELALRFCKNQPWATWAYLADFRII